MTENKKDAIVVDEAGKALVEKEEATVTPAKPNGSVEQSIISQLSLAGTIAFTKKQQEILFSEIPEEEVEIRPDGLIYLPWVGYVRRLRDAFGGKWSIIPKEPMPVMNKEDDGLMWGFYLVIDGKPYGYAIGEQKYFEDNKTMSWTDACEGCKSNALMRLCKGIGIGLEMWSPSFMKAWKQKWGIQEWDSYRRKKVWKKVDKPHEAMKQSAEKKMAQEPVQKESKPIKTEDAISPEELPTDNTPSEELVQKVLSIMGTLTDKFQIDPGYVILFFQKMLEEEYAVGFTDFKVPESLDDMHCQFIIDHFRDKKNPNIYNQTAVKQIQAFDPDEEKG